MYRDSQLNEGTVSSSLITATERVDKRQRKERKKDVQRKERGTEETRRDKQTDRQSGRDASVCAFETLPCEGSKHAHVKRERDL